MARPRVDPGWHPAPRALESGHRPQSRSRQPRPMSTIGPDPRLGLASGLDRIGGPLDDPRRPLEDRARRSGGAAAGVRSGDPAAEAAPAAPLLDAGERILAAPAWEGAAGRLLPGDSALEGRLGTLPLAQAAESAVDAVLDALG